jgi:hypothetical protein
MKLNELLNQVTNKNNFKDLKGYIDFCFNFISSELPMLSKSVIHNLCWSIVILK